MSGARTPEGRIRLALVITELEVGGAERCLVSLATRLDRDRFEPTVYSLGPRPQTGRDLLVQDLEAADVPVRFIDVRSSWQFISAIRRLRRWFIEQAPHIVQSFLFHANVTAAMAARRAYVPAVVTGVRVADPSGWRHFAERLVTRRVDRVVCVSQSVADFTHRVVNTPREKLVVIPNGVDATEFPAREPADLTEFGVSKDSKTMVYVGRLDRQKGVDRLVAEAPRILARLPMHHLLLVGDGPIRSELEAAAHASDVSTRIHFAGWQPNVAQILAASDLLLLPSRWEGMPNVLIEAMASSRPVVATNVEGVAEILGVKAASQAVEPGDDAAFVERVVAVASDDEIARALGEWNRHRVEQEFSIHGMVSAYERLYESLVTRR